MKRTIISAILVGSAALGFAQIDPTKVVAVVDGAEIRGAEYYHRMEFLPNVGRLAGNSFQPFFPGFMTLEQLINEKLIFELAKNKGVPPTEAQVQEELSYRLKLDPTYEEKYKASGRTHQDLLDDLKFELAQLNILTAGVNVTDQEVEQFYKNNKTMFTIPQQFKMRLIAVASASEAAAVDKELDAGKAFTDVAKAHSIDATGPIGGDVGLRTMDDFSDDVRKIIQSTAVGKYTPWFKAMQDKQFRFQIVEVVPEKLQELTPDVRRQARLRMRMDRGQIRNDIKKELNALRRKANIDIKDKALAAAYKQYIEAYLKATGG